jgi:hypothetical protein
MAKLELLVHTHDTLKAESVLGVPTLEPRNHASLARDFLAQFLDDKELLTIVQYHDEPFALWRQVQSKGCCDSERWGNLCGALSDWSLFALFIVVDSSTVGKDPNPRRWFLDELRKITALSDEAERAIHCLLRG